MKMVAKSTKRARRERDCCIAEGMEREVKVTERCKEYIDRRWRDDWVELNGMYGDERCEDSGSDSAMRERSLNILSVIYARNPKHPPPLFVVSSRKERLSSYRRADCQRTVAA